MKSAPPSSTRMQTEADGLDGSSLPMGMLMPGHRVGAYRLVRLLGTGGMGQVWLAEQQQPLQRTVALKLQRDRLPGGTAEVYFQIERQALAQLLHPYVAQIYDAGSLSDGTLYFAMEYVDGLRLDDWLQRRKPALPELIGLLIKLCQGVQHAHQRGLLHRDLKPANVLVMEVGGQILPKIIDFGVAIGLDPRSGVALSTRRAGTRAWMAPEQLRPGEAGIDARVDVYALGLLLALSMCRVLGLEEPEVGSAHLQTLFGRSTELEQRPTPNSDVARATVAMDMAARRSIPAELRAIAGRAIAQDREARYDSASAMADDLQRWCDRVPVRAMQGGRWYAARCFVRRNALATIAGSLILLALIVGLGTAAFGLAQARRAQAVAEARQHSAERLIGYMLGDFADKLRPLSKLDLLDGVSSEAMRYLQEHPVEPGAAMDAQAILNRARALRTVGEVLSGRGQAQEARTAFSEAERTLELAGSSPEQAEIWKERGTVAYWRGYMEYRDDQFDAAQVHWQDYLKHSVAYRTAGGDAVDADLEESYALDNLGTLAFEQNKFDEALQRFSDSTLLKQSVIAARPEDLDATIGLSNALSWMARSFEALGNIQGASERFTEQLRLIETVRARDPNAVQWMRNEALALYWLGQLELSRGDLELARELFVRCVDLYLDLSRNDSSAKRWVLLQALAVSQQAVVLQYLEGSASAREALDDAEALAEGLHASGFGGAELNRVMVAIQIRRALLARADGHRAKLVAALGRGLELVAVELQQPKPHRLTLQHYATLAALSAEQDADQHAQTAWKLLEPWLQVRQDRALQEAAARVLRALGQTDSALALIAELQASGYRHPDFVAFSQTEGASP